VTLSVHGSPRIVEEDPGQPRTTAPIDRSGEISGEGAGTKKAGQQAGLGFGELLKAADLAAAHTVPTRIGGEESSEGVRSADDLPVSSSRAVEHPGPSGLSKSPMTLVAPDTALAVSLPPLASSPRQATAGSRSTATQPGASSGAGRPVTQPVKPGEKKLVVSALEEVAPVLAHPTAVSPLPASDEPASDVRASASVGGVAAGGPAGLPGRTSAEVVAPPNRGEAGAGPESPGRPVDLLVSTGSEGVSRGSGATEPGLEDSTGEMDRAGRGALPVPVGGGVEGATTTRPRAIAPVALGGRSSSSETAREGDAGALRPRTTESASVEIAGQERPGGDGRAGDLSDRAPEYVAETWAGSESRPVESPPGTADAPAPEGLGVVETPSSAAARVSDLRASDQPLLAGGVHVRSERATELDNLRGGGSTQSGDRAVGVEVASTAGRVQPSRPPAGAAATGGSEGSVAPGEIDARVLRLVAPPAETKDGGWQTTVRLDPPDLGTVDATVTVRGGNVAVVLTYQTDATHGALQAALHTIQSNLGDRATVSLADGRLAGGGGGSGGGSGERSAGSSAPGAASSPESDNHVLLQQYSSVTPRHGQVDVLA